MKGFEGEQKISLNTSALESKRAASELLCNVSESMKSAFAPYVETVLPLMVDLSVYPYSKAIRKFAMKTFQHLLVAVGEPNNVQLF